MKKETTAAALLLLILFVSLWNLRRLGLLLDDLQTRSVRILNAAESGAWDTAFEASDALLLRWQNAADYTQVFLRHPDIDSVSDALTALSAAVRTQDADACFTAAHSVSTRLNSIRETETPSLGSIF